MDSLLLAVLLALVSLVYATVGQAGGTAFLAVMAAFGLAPEELRPTALALNVVAAGFTTWQLHRARAVDWRQLGLLAVSSLPMAFLGGLVVLDVRTYYLVVGCVLLGAAALMVARPVGTASRDLGRLAALSTGAFLGFVSGLTGVGGGVFLAPVLIGVGWTTAKQAVGLSAPFIFVNSVVALPGTLLAGDRITADFGLYAPAAVAGAVAGMLIGHRFLSERGTRYVLAAILASAGMKLLIQ
jgi:uncharacterized membrane protein YfcA